MQRNKKVSPKMRRAIKKKSVEINPELTQMFKSADRENKNNKNYFFHIFKKLQS